MQFTLATIASSLALLSELTLAATVQSKPFKLVTVSTDKKYNNVGLAPCHEGAGIEGLCPFGSNQVYRTNVTQGFQSGLKGYTPPGLLTLDLAVQGGGSIPSALNFLPDTSSNVAIALFYPGSGQEIFSFDSKNSLVVQTNSDDTVTPPTDTKSYALNRWYVCETNYEGHVFETLSWVYGKEAPQNPSCVKVSVKRIFT